MKDEKKRALLPIDIDAPQRIANGLPVSVQIEDKDGGILDVQTATLNTDTLPQSMTFDIVGSLRPSIAAIKISGINSAGTTFLMDNSLIKRPVGIAAPAQKDEDAPLIDASYYLKRALEPYATIKIAPIADLIAQDVPMIILPDIAAMPTDTLNALETWIKDGGLLLRFSGAMMSETIGAESFLLPVRLRAGGNVLSLALYHGQSHNPSPPSRKPAHFMG